MFDIDNCKWEQYLKYGERQFYRRKAKIYIEKEDGVNGFFYLKKGIVRISSSLHDGREQILDIVSSEQSFGEQAADGNKYFSTALALEDSIVYFFLTETIEKLMQEDDQFRMLVYTNLTEKLKTLANNVLFNSLPSKQLLAKTILILKDKFKSAYIPFTQQELCRYTTLNRVTIYKILKEWDEQIIKLDSKNLIVTNTRALERIAAI